MATTSEEFVTRISTNVFYKEFTFDRNEFYPSVGEQKELADNILWIDELLFIIQIKERNPNDVKTEKEENKWFSNVVLKKAKNQIKDSVGFFLTHDKIIIKNRREHSIRVTASNVETANKIVVYAHNSNLLSESNRHLKFYESQSIGHIHLLGVEDYYWLCRYLVTPAELDEYLKFRIELYRRHSSIVDKYPEQYVLAHFLNTPDVSSIDERYIETLPKLLAETEAFDLSGILKNFLENIRVEEQKQSTEYYQIVKEIAKLKRHELAEFKKRFQLIIEDAKSNRITLPYRFTVPRTGCGFVFIPLISEKANYWENALLNFTTIYKYKRKIEKCIGVVVFKYEAYFDINWAYMAGEWEYDEILELEVAKDNGVYCKPEIRLIERYKFRE